MFRLDRWYQKENIRNSDCSTTVTKSEKNPWTELNKERVRRLEKLGLMTEQGRKVLPDMTEDSFQMDEIIAERLKEDAAVYEIFLNFPELYRRIRIDTIQTYKHQPELFEKRLNKLIENTKSKKCMVPGMMKRVYLNKQQIFVI